MQSASFVCQFTFSSPCLSNTDNCHTANCFNMTIEERVFSAIPTNSPQIATIMMIIYRSLRKSTQPNTQRMCSSTFELTTHQILLLKNQSILMFISQVLPSMQSGKPDSLCPPLRQLLNVPAPYFVATKVKLWT